MNDKKKKDDNILFIVSAILVLCGIFLVFREAESLFVVGFIPMTGWLLGIAAIVLGVIVLVAAIKDKKHR